MALLIELCQKSHLELRYIYVSSIQLSKQHFCYVLSLELAICLFIRMICQSCISVVMNRRKISKWQFERSQDSFDAFRISISL